MSKDKEKLPVPNVMIKPVQYSKNPLKVGACFVVQNCVYQVYEMKTKGRMLVRFLGEARTAKEVMEEGKKDG